MYLVHVYVVNVLKFLSKLQTEGAEVLRTCYPAMKHESGDIIRPKDCILLRSGCKKTDLPYVAKVAHLWEDPDDGRIELNDFSCKGVR